MQHEISEPCKELIAQLSSFLDGELDAALCEQVKQHLATCLYCHTIADTTQKTIQLYHSSRLTVPREVHAHLIEALGLR
jgi:anti-sigma factor RsiW